MSSGINPIKCGCGVNCLTENVLVMHVMRDHPPQCVTCGKGRLSLTCGGGDLVACDNCGVTHLMTVIEGVIRKTRGSGIETPPHPD